MKVLVFREIVNEPEPGESGTIYEWVIEDAWGCVMARTFDGEFASWVAEAAGVKITER